MECERVFASQHQRDTIGRYTVPLPVQRGGRALLGDSLSHASLALASRHRRLQRDQELKREYTAFMEDYIHLGHMRQLTQREFVDKELVAHYIPHHPIWQRGDGGRRLRVVFNASRPTSSGRSLNDVLLPGPKLQNNLWTVIVRWRRHRAVFCADIRMMFRQIRIASGDAHLQRILWAPDSDHPAHHYVLTTVTYEEARAPYLALRTLHQLCSDEGEDLPEAVEAVEKELYVDDFLSGADDVSSACRRRDQLIRLLGAGGFELRKWVSNTPRLLLDIPAAARLRPTWMHFSTEGPVNELGLAWDPVADCFRFIPPSIDERSRVTKRRVLSELARLFDPAGWLSPVIVSAKMFLQDLWAPSCHGTRVFRLPWPRDGWTSEYACTTSKMSHFLGGFTLRNRATSSFTRSRTPVGVRSQLRQGWNSTRTYQRQSRHRQDEADAHQGLDAAGSTNGADDRPSIGA